MKKEFPAILDIECERVDSREKEFLEEFYRFSEYENDPVGQWVRIAKTRRENRDTDEFLLKLIVELHRKIDKLTELVEGKKVKYLDLKNSLKIISIDYGKFRLEKALESGKYYGRIFLPVFPQRIIPIFFDLKDDIGIISKIHHQDERDWDYFVAAKERAYIRELKRRKS